MTCLTQCPPPALDGARTWEQLDSIDRAEELRHPVRAAGALSPAAGDADTARSVRAWKLCMLVPHMLLTHAAQEGTQGRTELLSRFSRVAKATASARRGCRPQAQSGMCNNPQRRAFEVDLREATAGAKHFKFLAELFAEFYANPTLECAAYPRATRFEASWRVRLHSRGPPLSIGQHACTGSMCRLGQAQMPSPAFAKGRDAVLVSLDGRSAYDSMSRLAFLSHLREVA
ncbi:unnamed protein product [Symbiodinium natans]|uniref:Reverse transcriptase domain-containing protein n=1 Tax=Symbiodinium natans TaxID=878477 RepID=A0A812LGH0_9DINO|nr:unnamed protein product [Symbiodinium natans]